MSSTFLCSAQLMKPEGRLKRNRQDLCMRENRCEGMKGED